MLSLCSEPASMLVVVQIIWRKGAKFEGAQSVIIMLLLSHRTEPTTSHLPSVRHESSEGILTLYDNV